MNKTIFAHPALSFGIVLGTLFLSAGLACSQITTTPEKEIRITSPMNGATYKAPASIVVTVEGMDVPNVGHVIALYANGEQMHAIALDPLVPTHTTPVTFRFDFTLDDLPEGKYVLTAKIDNVTSEPVDVKVQAGHSKKKRH